MDSRRPAAENSGALNLYAPTLHGRAVKFDLSGLEPDFDPIYSVVIAATLHDPRRGPLAVPDTSLVLDMYLEVFQPDTTPVLPDLLHPDRTAASLAGFLQGKAALVSAAGRIAYRGSLLAEIFQDSSVHIILRLFRDGAGATAAPLQLRGSFTLYKGGSQSGSLQSTAPLPPDARAALIVARGPSLSWQRTIAGMTVAMPRMMGTAGHRRAPARAVRHAAPAASVRSGIALGSPALVGIAAGVVVLAAALLWLARRARGRTPRGVTGA